MFGIYDYLLGVSVLIYNKAAYEQFDNMVAKTKPELQVSHLVKKSWTLTRDCGQIVALAGGYKNADHYAYESDVKPRIHLISKPFFFLSSLDDPFFGPDVIPIDHCYDHILIGVTKTGGHCSYIEGAYLPEGPWFAKPTLDFLDHFH